MNHADGLKIQNVGSVTYNASAMMYYSSVVICHGLPIKLTFSMYIVIS